MRSEIQVSRKRAAQRQPNELTSPSIKHRTHWIGIVKSARSATAYNYDAVRGVNWRIPLPAGCRQKQLYKVFRLSGKPETEGYDLQPAANYRANFSSFAPFHNEILNKLPRKLFV